MIARTWYLVCAAVVGLTSGVPLVLFDNWRGVWMNIVDQIAGSTTLSAPVLAGFAAYSGWELRHTQPLWGSTVNAPRVLARGTLEIWLAALVGWGIVGLGLITFSLFDGASGPASWWPFVRGAATLFGAAAVGVGLGYLVPHPLTMVILPPAVFTTAWLFAPWSSMFRPGPVSGSLTGLTFHPWFTLSQMLMLAGVAGAVLVVASRSMLNRIPTLGILAASVGLILVPGALIKANAWDVHAFSGERATVCQRVPPAGTEICVAPSQGKFLASTVADFEPLLQVMVAQGLTPPPVLESYIAGSEGSQDAVVFTTLRKPWDKPDRYRAATGLFRPASCTAWSDPVAPPPGRAFAVEAVLADWIAVQAGEESRPRGRAQRQWLERADITDQRAWAKAAQEALMSCQFGELVLPWSKS